MNSIVPAYVYRARLVRVIDGDTYEFDIDLGLHCHCYAHIRLHGYFAPEMREPGGPEAKKAAEDLFATAREIIIITLKDKSGTVETMSFSRYVADVYIDGVPIAMKLQHLGHLKVENRKTVRW